MLLVGPGGARSWINGLEAHLVHQAGDALVIDLEIMLVVQPGRHLAVTVEWRLGVFLVNQPHQLQVEQRFTGRLPIVRRPVEADQLALAANTQHRMVCVNHRPFGLSRTGQLFFSATQVPS